MKTERNLTIIGLGGIGSILSNVISRFVSTKLQNEEIDININLIDGDDYQIENKERQEFSNYGNKAESKMNELKEKYFNINFRDYNVFIDENNISKIIKNQDIVFLAVDNHKTRKIVSDYANNKLEDIIIISGGNELEDGNVQLYMKKGGKELTPSLTDYHPEIQNPVDKHPNEMSCEELQKSEPQLYFTNLGVATFMAFTFYNVLNDNYKFSEVYFDMKTMKSDSKTRTIKNKKGE